MKIMEICSGGDVNGAIAHCHLLIEQFVRRGHRIVLVCPHGAWIGRRLEGNRSVEVVPSDMHRWPPDELSRVARLARDRGVDVLHSHMSRAHTFGVLLRAMSGIPSVATAHNRHVQLHWMFNDRVIGVSETTTRFHRRFNLVRRRCSETIHNFIDDAPFRAIDPADRLEVRAELGVADEHVLLGVVGNIIARKGLIYLVRALPRILAAAPQTRLAAIGAVKDGPEYCDRVKAEADRLGVASAIHWAGHRSDVPRVLAGLDVFVLPSLEECFPLSILEAMASARPVVGSAVGGIPEAVDDRRTGALVRPADPDALAEALAPLIADEDLRRRWGRAGRRRVSAEFSAESQAARVEAALASVLRPKRKAA